MKRNIIILLLLTIIFVYAVAFHKQPFQITGDMAVAKDFTRRLAVPEKDPVYGSLHFNNNTKQLLDHTAYDALAGIRCSDSFIRTEQGVYILENQKINYKLTRRVKNDKFLEFMRNKEAEFPKGKKILTAKICETTDKNLILFYSIGEYDIQVVDTTNIRKAILYSKGNHAYVQFFSNNFLTASQTFEIGRSKAHIRCDKPFQIDTGSVLTVLCSEEEDWVTSFYVYQINLKNGKTVNLGTCRNRFENYMNRLIKSECN